MRSLALLLSSALVAPILSCDGCDEEREGKPLASAAQTDDSIQPVYPANPGKVPALVSRLCKALHELPRRKRADCCKTTVGVVLTSECERNLAGAIASEGVAIDDERVAACEQAIEAMHGSCDWIGPWQAPTPAACLGIVRGKRGVDQPCRSSLECVGSLRCLGVGPTDPGVCGEPPPPGSLCGAAVDPLAVYARQDDVDRQHPQCSEGFCDRARCVAFSEEGGECAASVQCRSGRCVGGKCAAEGAAACSGGECAPGTRCIGGECREPKGIGESCADHQECKSACVSGKCAMQCLSPALLRGLIKTATISR
jgi:hypothetical protein